MARAKSFKVALSLAALLPEPVPAAPPPLVTLAKYGPWVADYDVNRCRLIGRFGIGENEMTAIFTRFGPGDGLYITLIGQPLALANNRTLPDVKYAFGPGQVLSSKRVLAASIDGKPALVSLQARLDGSDMPTNDGEIAPRISEAFENAVTQFDLAFGPGRRFRLALGSMGKPMLQLRRCTDMLMASWGYDPQQYAALRKPALPQNSPRNWLTASDYPMSAIEKGQQGRVQFRLDVDETGQVSGCHILQQSKPENFGDLSCRLLMKRARFNPAEDVGGEPVKSFFVSNVMFTM